MTGGAGEELTRLRNGSDLDSFSPCVGGKSVIGLLLYITELDLTAK